MSRKRINLALQGGGAHGAFTWGVLDRLLEESELEIAAISGTSAGALNGAALKAGLASGDAQTARENLDWFWGRVGAVNDPNLASWMSALAPAAGPLATAMESSWPYQAMDFASRLSSPYAMGPFYQNPLDPIVNDMHFDAICSPKGPELHVCATNVQTGKIRVFAGDDISVNALLASACLPTMFQAIEIHDPKVDAIQSYWDGGFMGNPPLFPLFEAHLPQDVMIVNINPLVRHEVPKTPQEIQNRINEISFNSSLLRELRAIDFVRRLLADGSVKPGSMKDVLVHMIADDALMNTLNVATKLLPSPIILAKLKAAGRVAADQFLQAHWDDIGVTSSCDLRPMFA
ncbi:patatin-like phospholipase family protein [Algirhabdus cladophorae]|uniref:patatin-like phospholipase family protein n=1 Tax=Algirhabdus cladophorae TaxID=3377108 RepID=UPI003B8470B5